MEKPRFCMLHTNGSLLCFLVFAMIATSGIVHGNGNFYLEKVPVGVPYQRAIILFEDGKETLILQSKYKSIVTEGNNPIGWVVPVPSVPELESMGADEAGWLFLRLDINSHPDIFSIMRIVQIVILLIIVVLIWLACKLISKGAKPLTLKLFTAAVIIMFCVLIITIVIPIMRGRLGGAGVDVLKEEAVGIYDVKVISGDDAGAVNQWLIDNGYRYGEADTEVLGQYVKKGWCFVTAKVNKNVNMTSEGAVSEGLAAPLIMKFDSKDAVYPMALTGTTGDRTEILLYVLSNFKVECGGRLKMAFSDEMDFSHWGRLSSFFVGDADTKLFQMNKFKGKLDPNQMEEDIVFKQAKNNKPYREIRWQL